MRMLDRKWFRWTLIILVGVVTWLAYPLVAEAEVRFGDRGDEVRQVQEALTEGGWPVVIDGIFGFQTHGTVAMYQRANGLTVDGIAGPETQGHLGLATATETAVRRGNYEPFIGSAGTPTPPPPQKSTWTRCPQWEELAEFFGLPDQFDYIMWRESRCRPDVTSSTGCCRGLLQIHRIHLPNPLCGAYTPSDLFQPAANLCVASGLYQRAGMQPWAL